MFPAPKMITHYSFEAILTSTDAEIAYVVQAKAGQRLMTRVLSHPLVRCEVVALSNANNTPPSALASDCLIIATGFYRICVVRPLHADAGEIPFKLFISVE